MENEIYTNEEAQIRSQDKSQSMVKLTKNRSKPLLNRCICQRKRYRRTHKRFQNDHNQQQQTLRRTVASSPKPKLDEKRSNITSTVTTIDSFDDFWNEDCVHFLREAYDFEIMNTLNHKHQWEQQQLNDFENFNDLQQMLLMYDEIEQINQAEVINVSHIELARQLYDEEHIKTGNKENIAFFP
ncbi:hypothetical protein I4U23_010806 [Adineta vaga]|nr:hypothetical protein I4U23_010806 [Adineta vaga]